MYRVRRLQPWLSSRDQGFSKSPVRAILWAVVSVPAPFEVFDSFSNAQSRVSHTLYQYPLSGQLLDCLGKICEAGYQPCSNESVRVVAIAGVEGLARWILPKKLGFH